MHIDPYRIKVFHNNKGQLHRVDGPAVEHSDGTKYWYINRELHRIDGPAIEYSNGRKEWYVNGVCHRLDGPAIEWSNGRKEWRANYQKIDTINNLLNMLKVKVR